MAKKVIRRASTRRTELVEKHAHDDAESNNSIVIKTAHEVVKSLNPYYRNPRIGDVEKVAESLSENGQFKPIVVNIGTQTGRPREILGGNHTWLAARKLQWSTIFVAWVDVSEVDAKKIVLADNGTSDGSTYDDGILGELLLGIKDAGASLIGTTYTDKTLDALIKTNDSRTKNSGVDKIDEADDTLEGIADFQIAPFFESDLVYDIPPLLENMIPDDIPGSPLEVWAGHEIDLSRQEEDPNRWWMTQWHAGNMHVNWSQSVAYFYTEDFHFENIYTDPGVAAKKLMNLGVKYVIMPNYSVHPTWPIATWIWSAYRSAYVARYFQEAGLMVIPDIQYGVDESLPISMACIPEEAGLCAVQLQNTRGNHSEIRAVARLLKQAEDMKGFQNLIVYGHTDAQEVLDRAKLECNIHFVSNRSARRREYLNSQSTINSQKVRKGTRKKKASASDA
jgi:hypothetical protein